MSKLMSGGQWVCSGGGWYSSGFVPRKKGKFRFGASVQADTNAHFSNIGLRRIYLAVKKTSEGTDVAHE